MSNGNNLLQIGILRIIDLGIFDTELRVKVSRMKHYKYKLLRVLKC